MAKKYKIITIAIILCIVVCLVGCNSSTEAINNKDNVIDVSKDSEITSWDDDKVLSFSDQALQLTIRDITGVYEGNITYEHVKYIKSIGIGTAKISSGAVTTVSNTVGLKYFSSLEDLHIFSFDGEVVKLDGLKNLKTISTDWSSKDFGFQFLNMQGQTVLIDDKEVCIETDDFYFNSWK